MPTYHYRCDTCEHEEELDQPMGSPREHECPECEEGTCKRFIKKVNELTAGGKGTPGSQVERSKEHRSIDNNLTRIRRAHGKGPNTEGDQLAADRHWGRKNGIVE